MRTSDTIESNKLADHLRRVRADKDLTLAELAAKSGVSRATLSRIENAEVSPTAETLGRLAAALGVATSWLLAPMDKGFQPVIRRSGQSVWQDEQNGFARRCVSPPNGQLVLELIEGTMEAGHKIFYETPPVPGQEHHVLILSGKLTISLGETTYVLEPGDCLRYKLFGSSQFRTTDAPARYLIALA